MACCVVCLEEDGELFQLCKCMCAHKDCAMPLLERFETCTICGQVTKMSPLDSSMASNSCDKPQSRDRGIKRKSPERDLQTVQDAAQKHKKIIDGLHAKYPWVARIMPSFCRRWREELSSRGQTVYDITDHDCVSIVLSIVFGDYHMEDLQSEADAPTAAHSRDDCGALEEFAMLLTIDKSEPCLELENHFSNCFRHWITTSWNSAGTVTATPAPAHPVVAAAACT